jgi:hypothetical protein
LEHGAVSISYAKARTAHLEAKLRARGSCFEGLSDLTRWYSLSASEAAALALAVGLRLSEGEVASLRAAIHATAEANALATGRSAPEEPPQAAQVRALPPIKSYRK